MFEGPTWEGPFSAKAEIERLRGEVEQLTERLKRVTAQRVLLSTENERLRSDLEYAVLMALEIGAECKQLDAAEEKIKRPVCYPRCSTNQCRAGGEEMTEWPEQMRRLEDIMSESLGRIRDAAIEAGATWELEAAVSLGRYYTSRGMRSQVPPRWRGKNDVPS